MRAGREDQPARRSAGPASSGDACASVCAFATAELPVARASARSAASTTRAGAINRQASEIARAHSALIARTARQVGHLDRLGHERSVRHGADRAGSVGPYRPTIGTSVVPATWSGPLSPPMNSAARRSAPAARRDRNLAVDHPVASVRRARPRRAADHAPAASCSDGPDVTTTRRSGLAADERRDQGRRTMRPATAGTGCRR